MSKVKPEDTITIGGGRVYRKEKIVTFKRMASGKDGEFAKDVAQSLARDAGFSFEEIADNATSTSSAFVSNWGSGSVWNEIREKKRTGKLLPLAPLKSTLKS